MIGNLSGFDENYIGTNYMAYKHRYFLGEYIAPVITTEDKEELPFTNYQKAEVGQLMWKSLEQCLEDIRPYHLEKKQLLKNIDIIIQNYVIS
jgi:hypothetical protein